MKFAKMHGIGNDYLYINCFDEGEDHDWSRLSIMASDRHFGVGSDGIILIAPGKNTRFRMRIFNADGSEGDMCGNGIRCFAKYVFDRKMTMDREFDVETRAGIMRPQIVSESDGITQVRVNMGKPSLLPKDIPMIAPAGEDAIDVPVEALSKRYLVTGVRMGNPNGVVFVDDLRTVNLEVEGRALEIHPVFPKKANIEFTHVVSPDQIHMRVWERGSGVTLACGTGASACLVASAVTGRTRRKATVSLPGGELLIDWAEEDGNVYMTGPAEEICTGDLTKWKASARQ